MSAKQRSALKFARFFTPNGRAALLAGDALTNVVPAGVAARLLLRNMPRPVPGLPACEEDRIEPGQPRPPRTRRADHEAGGLSAHPPSRARIQPASAVSSTRPAATPSISATASSGSKASR